MRTPSLPLNEPPVLARKASSSVAKNPVPHEEEYFSAQASRPGAIAMEAEKADAFDQELANAQEQLRALREKEVEIEKQRDELKQLSMKQERFGTGRRDIVNKLSRSIIAIERSLNEKEKQMEQMLAARDAFMQHLDILKELRPENWSRAHLSEELDRSLALIDGADVDFSMASRKIALLRGEDEGEAGAGPAGRQAHATAMRENERDFMYWLRAGFAFTLPLMVLAFLLFIVSKMI